MDEGKRLSGRKEFLWVRARMIQSIRRFFIGQGYLEVETPQLILAPAPEQHIRAIPVGERFLHTSPELCMKRLLASGYPKIFQLTKCFRDGERGKLHLPEFSLLEWYRANIDYQELMGECEALFLSLAQDLGLGGSIQYQGMNISLESPWEKIQVSQAFERYTSFTLDEALERGRFDELMVSEIEPNLGVSRPVFLVDYPASMASLARLKPDDPGLAERFEVYLGGLELANGFTELNDAKEQRVRFEKEQIQRRDLGEVVYPMPERFLMCLQHMPDAAGIALGLDRLAMVLTNAPTIDHVVSFTPEEA